MTRASWKGPRRDSEPGRVAQGAAGKRLLHEPECQHEGGPDGPPPNAEGQAPRATPKLLNGSDLTPAPQPENMHRPGSPAPTSLGGWGILSAEEQSLQVALGGNTTLVYHSDQRIPHQNIAFEKRFVLDCACRVRDC